MRLKNDTMASTDATVLVLLKTLNHFLLKCIKYVVPRTNLRTRKGCLDKVLK